MGPHPDNPPLIVILGQTGTGKSSLAMDIATQFNGEILAADSRTVYRGMDISTAKPTANDMRQVRHHLIDLVEPDQQFTVADFKRLAQEAMDQVTARSKLPILVGGTGMYIDALIYDFDFRGGPADPKRRSTLNDLSVGELQQILVDNTIPLPDNAKNPRHLIRAIETGGVKPHKGPLRPNTLLIGISFEGHELRPRISKRVHSMVEAGLVKEIRSITNSYGWDLPALQTPAFKAFRPYIEGHVTLEEAVERFVQYDMQYAKRQKTWFKRNTDINWISKKEKIVDLLTTFLSK